MDKNLEATIIAIPSEQPGGLDARIGAHFGHCDLYTLVSVAGGEVKAVTTIPNIPHQHGGCMAPVQYLAEKGVKALIAGGMGMRPLMGFNQMGIEVFHGAHAENVFQAVESLLNNQLARFTQEFTCGGSHSSTSGCGSH